MFANHVTHNKRLRSLVASASLVLLLTPALSTSVRASPTYTDVGGPIIFDTHWTLVDSPYVVTSNVQVTAGVTLTIEPGVVVRFNKDRILQVDGTLIARGTVGNWVTFTSNQPSPQKGDWGNIYFTDGSTDATFDASGNYQSGSVLQYCAVEWGGSGVESAIHAPSAAPFVDHCTVRNNACRGIRVAAGDEESLNPIPAVVSNNTITGNTNTESNYFNGGGGIHATNSLVLSNTVIGNSSAGSCGGISASYSTVSHNIVIGNSSVRDGGGICASDSQSVSHNTISGNSALYGGGIYATSYTVVSDNTVTGNNGGRGGGIYSEWNCTVSNNVVMGNLGRLGGGIYGDFSTISNNLVSGNRSKADAVYGGGGGGIYIEYGSVDSNIVTGNSATDADGSGGYGGGIYAAQGSDIIMSRVISNTVVDNSATRQGSGVYSAADLFDNTIVGNTTVSPTGIIGGLAVNGTPHVHDNNLYGNSNYDVVVLSSHYYDISGTYNYWGTVVDADISAHIYDGYDDANRAKFLYIPYLQDPASTAPVPPPGNLQANFASGYAALSWDAIPSTTTGYRYKVYYDNDAPGPPYNGTGAAQGNSPIVVGNVTSYTLSGLGNEIHYITVTTYDDQGRESWYSNEVNSLRRVYLPVVLRDN